MKEVWKKYFQKKKLQLKDTARNARMHKFCYLFLLPYAILFITFNVFPIINSIFRGILNLLKLNLSKIVSGNFILYFSISIFGILVVQYLNFLFPMFFFLILHKYIINDIIIL